MVSSVGFSFEKKKKKTWRTVLKSVFWEAFPNFWVVLWKLFCVIYFDGSPVIFFWIINIESFDSSLCVYRTTLFWRVWSWLRVNAGGMVKTCKSNEKQDFGFVESGERVRNTWATCPWVWNSPTKVGLMPYVAFLRMMKWLKLVMALKDGLAAYQLVGEVKAHQG